MNATDAHPAGRIRLLIDLTRAPLSLLVTLSSAAGYLLATRRFEVGMVWPVLGTYLLASGASALNQAQEAGIDARMRRTRRRPIPSGRVRPAAACWIGGTLILLGLAALTSAHRGAAAAGALGLAALVWYNGVYTWLKRVSAFAVVPGALIGAVPPVIGWVSAGAAPRSPVIVLVAIFFFLWQIPHFWLLSLIYREDHISAGLPSAARIFSPAQLRRVTAMWIFAAAAWGMAFPALARGLIGWVWGLALLAASIWLAEEALTLLMTNQSEEIAHRRAFRRVNLYALIFIVCLSLGALTN